MSWLQAGWAQAGFAGIVAYVIIMIMTGRLVPRSVSKALVDQANHNADTHQAAAAAADARADLAVKAMLESAAATRALEQLVRTGLPDRMADS